LNLLAGRFNWRPFSYQTKRAMSRAGTKRQFARCKAMSGVGGKADLPVERPDFSLWPMLSKKPFSGEGRKF
jgi:hypothetical protein